MASLLLDLGFSVFNIIFAALLMTWTRTIPAPSSTTQDYSISECFQNCLKLAILNAIIPIIGKLEVPIGSVYRRIWNLLSLHVQMLNDARLSVCWLQVRTWLFRTSIIKNTFTLIKCHYWNIVKTLTILDISRKMDLDFVAPTITLCLCMLLVILNQTSTVIIINNYKFLYTCM